MPQLGLVDGVQAGDLVDDTIPSHFGLVIPVDNPPAECGI